MRFTISIFLIFFILLGLIVFYPNNENIESDIAPVPDVVPDIISDIDPRTYKEAVAMANSQNRYLFVYFTSLDCNDCKKMKSVFQNDWVRQAVNNFVSIEINARDPHYEYLVKGAKITRLPAFRIVLPDLRVIRQFDGFMAATELVDFLDLKEFEL
jgi:thioredoxin-related protein